MAKKGKQKDVYRLDIDKTIDYLLRPKYPMVYFDPKSIIIVTHKEVLTFSKLFVALYENYELYQRQGKETWGLTAQMLHDKTKLAQVTVRLWTRLFVPIFITVKSVYPKRDRIPDKFRSPCHYFSLTKVGFKLAEKMLERIEHPVEEDESEYDGVVEDETEVEFGV